MSLCPPGKHIGPRESAVPGDRTRVTLDVAESSLPLLMEGIDAVRCWLSDEGDGTYAFHATQSLGNSRAQVGEPAADILRKLLNEFADNLAAPDVPRWLREAWDQMVDNYTSRTAPATPLEDE